MAIGDIPNGYSVNQIRFSPDNKSIFIRSFYPWSMRCEQVEANLALHKIDLQNTSHTKLFEKDYCQYIPVGTIQFTNDGKMFLFARRMAEQYWISILTQLLGASIK